MACMVEHCRGCDQNGDGFGGIFLTTGGIGNMEDDGVGSGEGIEVCRVLERGCSSVAEVPCPTGDGS